MATVSTRTSESAIRLHGVRTHNLRNVDVAIPIGKLTVITGVSGSGKSSLAFDTLHAESQRRYIETFSAYSRQFMPMLDKAPIDRIENVPPSISVARNARGARIAVRVAVASGIADYLRLAFARAASVICPECGIPVRPWTTAQIVDELTQTAPDTLVTIAFPFVRDLDRDLSAQVDTLREQGFLRLQVRDEILRTDDPIPLIGITQLIRVHVDRIKIGASSNSRVYEAIETAIHHGEGFVDIEVAGQWRRYSELPDCPSCGELFPSPDPSLFLTSNPMSACPACSGSGRAAAVDREDGVGESSACPQCAGKRFRREVLAYHWLGANFDDWSRFSVEHAKRVLRDAESTLAAGDASLRALHGHLSKRIDSLWELGLGHVTLDRGIRSLSTGEARRVSLAGVLGAGLARSLFVLDEPTTGLHPSEVSRLLVAARRLCADQNTVVLVEHDPQIIRMADEVIDLGPGAGAEGGRIVFQGAADDLVHSKESTTAQYLRSRLIPRASVRSPRGSLDLRGARTNNLKDVNVSFPLGCMTVVAGVSGSGKSSLVADTLFPAMTSFLRKTVVAEQGKQSADDPRDRSRFDGLDSVEGGERIHDVVLVDDDAVARTPRGNPATYLKIFGDIRSLFAETADAKVAGLGPGDFSFNRPGGRCDTCEGLGWLAVDMHFLPDVRTVCPDCSGERYQSRVLDVKFRGRNIVEILALPVREAFGFFRGERSIQVRIAALKEAGLDYLPLGQPLSTLSGGEAQRLKLASHVAGRAGGRTLFLFDEPTSGQHAADVDRWLGSVELLLDAGHTVVIVEHNLRVIARADVVIELGPGAGKEGGQVIAVATPDELAKLETATGRELRKASRDL